MLFRQNVKVAFLYLGTLAVIGALSTSLAFAQPRIFKDQDLNGKSFEGQGLDGADFSGATLVWTIFKGASLRGAKFSGAQVQNIDLSGADLTGADMHNMIGVQNLFFSFQTNFTDVNMEGLDLNDQLFYQANFSNANLRGTTGWGSISSSNFRGADLRGANLRSAPNGGGMEGMFVGAKYNGDTLWPKWFDAAKSGAKMVP